MPLNTVSSWRTAHELIVDKKGDWRDYVNNMSGKALKLIEHDWDFWRRADQIPPDGDWCLWLVMAGRGFGKTRMGAQWVREKALANPQARIAIIGATLAEARSVMVEGESGILLISGDERPDWEPSLRRLKWNNGAVATLYSAAEPESLRGPQHSHAWADEVAKWQNGNAAWDNLMLGLRVGDNPQAMATTTPRSVALLKRLLAQDGVVVTRGGSAANIAALSAGFLDQMRTLYAGTRLEKQELMGELITEPDGALWSLELIESRRVADVRLPDMKRIVIGVDPPAGSVSGKGGDACGIVAAGLGEDGKAYVLADHSVRGLSPDGWARAVAAAAQAWNADRVIAEANQGGQMVAATLRAADVNLPVKLVHASHGKSARAEPVAALFEGGRAMFAGVFAELEAELCGMISGGGYEGPGRSPDRADACVWALTELMLGKVRAVPRVRLL